MNGNHYKKLELQEQLILQAIFIIIGVKNNGVCEFFLNYDSWVIIHQTMVSTDITDATYIDERNIDMILSYHFRSRFLSSMKNNIIVYFKLNRLKLIFAKHIHQGLDLID